MWCMVMAASCAAINGDAATQLGLADNASARNRHRHVPSTCPISAFGHRFRSAIHLAIQRIPGDFR